MTDDRIEQLERDLGAASDRAAATAEVLEVIGRPAFELEPVFETVLRQAVRLCCADAGLIYVLDDDVYRMALALIGIAAAAAVLLAVAIADTVAVGEQALSRSA